MRLVLFLITGLLLQQEVWIAALYLFPFMALGMFVGHRLHVRMTAAQIGRVISVLLLLTGVSILAKAILSTLGPCALPLSARGDTMHSW